MSPDAVMALKIFFGVGVLILLVIWFYIGYRWEKNNLVHENSGPSAIRDGRYHGTQQWPWGAVPQPHGEVPERFRGTPEAVGAELPAPPRLRGRPRQWRPEGRTYQYGRSTYNYATSGTMINGGLAERSIAPVLKTGGPSGPEGSNPSPSSTINKEEIRNIKLLKRKEET